MAFFKNPFKGRQPGTSLSDIEADMRAIDRRIAESLREEHHHKKVLEAFKLLRSSPGATDTELAAALHLSADAAEPFITNARELLLKAKLQQGNQPENVTPPATPAPLPQAPPNTPPASNSSSTGGKPSSAQPQAQKQTSKLDRVTKDGITLVTLSPEDALLHVQEERDRVEFGQGRIQGFMANFNQIWALIGPFLFAAGTIGEIFLVLWDRQVHKDYFAGFVIVIVSMIAEGGLLAVSFSAKLLRNRADKRQTGWTRREKEKLAGIKNIWWLLSLGVAATQIAFVMSQTRSDDIGGFWGLFAIAAVRAAVAMVADYYTAYISEEHATSADAALEEQTQRTEFTQKMLDCKTTEVEVINAGTIKVQEAVQQASTNQQRTELRAEMERDTMQTERELTRLENENKIARMKAKFAEEAAWSELQVSSTRAMRERIDHMTRQMLNGDEPLKVVNSTLDYLVTEVKDLKSKQLPGGKARNTGPLHEVSMEEDD